MKFSSQKVSKLSGNFQLPTLILTYGVYFLWPSPQKFLVLIWSTSEEWKAELTLEPPSCFELRTHSPENFSQKTFAVSRWPGVTCVHLLRLTELAVKKHKSWYLTWKTIVSNLKHQFSTLKEEICILPDEIKGLVALFTHIAWIATFCHMKWSFRKQGV